MDEGASVSLLTIMGEGAEETKSRHGKRYAIIGVVFIIALAVGLPLGIKRRKEQKDLNVACTFLSIIKTV
jgi:ABC-type proline/glycine betaine transport system permease subunit